VLFVGAGEMIELVATHFAARTPKAMAWPTARWSAARSWPPASAPRRCACRPAQPAARVRRGRLLHRQHAADHRPGRGGARAEASPPPPDVHGRPGRAARHRARGRQLGDVYLYTVDDLSALVQTAGEKRQAAVEQAEAIIDAGVQSFAHWLDQRAAVPLIQALNRQADDWGAAETGARRKLLAKGEPVEPVLEALARGLTHKMLHGTPGRAALRRRRASASSWPTPCRACSCARARAPGRRRPQRALAPVRRPRAAGRPALQCPPMTPIPAQQFERLAMRLANSTPRWPTRRCPGRHQALPQPVARTGRGAGIVAFRRYQQRERDLAARAGDAGRPLPEMAEPWRGGDRQRRADLTRLHAELQAALLPRDPDDERNAFLEIRAGTGGDESALFAGDLARMYLRFCERQGWRTEVLSEKRRRTGRLQGTGAARRGRHVYGRCASSPAATACSACRPPRRRAASTPAPARWR
jgi:hypothetical protein